jgi:hypothetical protein
MYESDRNHVLINYDDIESYIFFLKLLPFLRVFCMILNIKHLLVPLYSQSIYKLAICCCETQI